MLDEHSLFWWVGRCDESLTLRFAKLKMALRAVEVLGDGRKYRLIRIITRLRGDIRPFWNPDATPFSGVEYNELVEENGSSVCVVG